MERSDILARPPSGLMSAIWECGVAILRGCLLKVLASRRPCTWNAPDPQDERSRLICLIARQYQGPP